jgi:hypothetical protein
MRHRLRVVLAVFLPVIACGTASLSRAAEELEITHCYSGTFALLHEAKDILPAGS